MTQGPGSSSCCMAAAGFAFYGSSGSSGGPGASSPGRLWLPRCGSFPVDISLKLQRSLWTLQSTSKRYQMTNCKLQDDVNVTHTLTYIRTLYKCSYTSYDCVNAFFVCAPGNHCFVSFFRLASRLSGLWWLRLQWLQRLHGCYALGSAGMTFKVSTMSNSSILIC